MPCLVYGQHPLFQNLRSFDGLASDYVYCCFQDKAGYLWFGTEMGVSRYDGYEFENFDAKDGMTGNEIFQVFQDSQERIWMLSYNGELCYFKNGIFYNSNNDLALRNVKSNSFISCFFEAQDGTLYFGTANDGLFAINPQNQIKKYFFLGIVSQIWELNTGEIAVLGVSGFFTIKDGLVAPIKEYNHISRGWRTISFNNTLYCSQENSLFKLHENGELEFIFELPPQAEITHLSYRDTNAIYLTTRTGLFTATMDQFEVSPDAYLKGTVLSHSLVDREGNLWITTLGDGVFMSSSPNTKFFDKESSPPLNHISSLGKGLNNELWIGLKNGHFLRLMDSKLTEYKIKNNVNQAVTEIRTFGNAVYILSKTSMVVIENGDTNYFSFLANDILVTENHVYLASKNLAKLTHPFFNENLKPVPGRDNIFHYEMTDRCLLDYNTYTLCKANNGRVYIGTQRGLFSEFDDKITVYTTHYPEGLSSSINALCYDPMRNLVYVGTNSQGLIILQNDKVVATLTANEGLSGNNCQSLLLDENGNLWIGTARNIDLLDFTTKSAPEVVNYGGLLNLSSTRILDIEMVEKTLYLATEYGLIAHEIGTIKSSPISPSVYINSVTVNSTPKNFTDSSLLVLNHYENSVAIGFTGILHKKSGNITYQYRLKGYQDIWRTTKNRMAVFEALPAGKFTFQVRVLNSAGKNNPMASIEFEILKPFWRTLWFSALLFFLLIGTLMLIWFFRIRSIRANYELERQIVAAELEKLEMEKAYMRAEQKAGVLQMNPHFLFNSLNTIKGFYAQNKFNEANRFISRFSRLLRRILECNTVLIPLEKELEILDLYLELMQKRYDGIFEFEIRCDLEVEQIELPPMMIQPMVENAVIHGIAPLNKGKVAVHFFQENNYLVCTVTDNGIGFNNSHKQAHQSVGLANIKDRLQLLAKQFSLTSKIEIISPNNLSDNTGTTVIIQFPIKINQPCEP